ncbi:hypothetical protein [Enterobacter hormaechei]|uniref:hypothetical protein n=1 Tax=Enterobacter hormaechei TaxID=158836 RepID=UPI000759130B|nr:hypothetical protein [Enterobacter hormaechei]KVI80707.1 hypothetical protein AWS45_10065 [Enterobacter hormaechei subsp. xiangfangensis]
MSIKNLVEMIKRNGLLASMPQLEELHQVAIENELKLAESQREFRAADATIENLQMQVEKLAAENAGLKAGFKYFSYSEMAGFEEHGTAELAMKSADADLAGERDEASSEGWSEETDTICWGVIVQKAVENKFEKPSEENGWIGWSDYALLPSIETPATDAFLAEVRASAIDSLVDIKTKQLADMHPDTHAFGATAMSIRSQINELQMFAAQLRKGVQS